MQACLPALSKALGNIMDRFTVIRPHHALLQEWADSDEPTEDQIAKKFQVRAPVPLLGPDNREAERRVSLKKKGSVLFPSFMRVCLPHEAIQQLIMVLLC